MFSEYSSRVLFQFSFSSPHIVPKSLPVYIKEDNDDHNNAAQIFRGRMFGGPQPGVSLADTPYILVGAGYNVGSAYTLEREDKKNSRRTFWTTRFIFRRVEHEVNVTPAFFEFEKFCREAVWRVRIYENPSDAGVALSVNMDARNPLYRPDGTRVFQWKRDSWGNKTEKQYVIPAYALQIRQREGEIALRFVPW